MNITTLSFRNMRRKPARTLLLMMVFTLGISSIISLYQISQVVGLNLEKKLTAFGANIIIKPKAETLSVSYGGFSLGEMLFEIPQLQHQESLEAVSSIALRDRISLVAPKLITTEKIGQHRAAVIGVEWQEELALKSYWAVEGAFPTSENQLILGKSLSEKTGLVVGDSITLSDRLFEISGVLYETGTDDDTAVFMALPSLQGLTDADNSISFIEIAALCKGCPIEDIVTQLEEALPGGDVKALQNVVNQRMASIHFVQKLALLISLIILLTAAAMIGLSMLSAVNERKKDIGILRSLGYKKSSVFFIFCLEAAIIGSLAGITGYVSGFFASFSILDLLAIADATPPVFSLSHFVLTPLFFSGIAVVSVMYPAWKGASIEPSNALTAL